MTELPFVYGWIAGGNFIGAVYAAVAGNLGKAAVMGALATSFIGLHYANRKRRKERQR